PIHSALRSPSAESSNSRRVVCRLRTSTDWRKMKDIERRRKLRALLAGSKCLLPASIYDPLSPRIPQSIDYQISMLPETLISGTAPETQDCVLKTLTRCAHQVPRFARARNLSVFVDGDNGFGNALNVMRTVEELEHAGVAALSIEDTALPIAFGQCAGQEKL